MCVTPCVYPWPLSAPGSRIPAGPPCLSVVLTASSACCVPGSSRTPSLGGSSYPSSQSYGEQQPKKVEPMSEGKASLGCPLIFILFIKHFLLLIFTFTKAIKEVHRKNRTHWLVEWVQACCTHPLKWGGGGESLLPCPSGLWGLGPLHAPWLLLTILPYD